MEWSILIASCLPGGSKFWFKYLCNEKCPLTPKRFGGHMCDFIKRTNVVAPTDHHTNPSLTILVFLLFSCCHIPLSLYQDANCFQCPRLYCILNPCHQLFYTKLFTPEKKSNQSNRTKITVMVVQSDTYNPCLDPLQFKDVKMIQTMFSACNLIVSAKNNV